MWGSFWATAGGRADCSFWLTTAAAVSGWEFVEVMVLVLCLKGQSQRKDAAKCFVACARAFSDEARRQVPSRVPGLGSARQLPAKSALLGDDKYRKEWHADQDGFSSQAQMSKGVQGVRAAASGFGCWMVVSGVLRSLGPSQVFSHGRHAPGLGTSAKGNPSPALTGGWNSVSGTEQLCTQGRLFLSLSATFTEQKVYSDLRICNDSLRFSRFTSCNPTLWKSVS